MQEKELISIVVPIYNAQDWLKQCIESIISQTYRNLEILLVDDGSRDHSGELCDAYAKNDPRIRVIHKENGGLVSARKTGVKNARGKYIGFVDSDDWIDPNMYEQLYVYAKQNDADIVCSALLKEYGTKRELYTDGVAEDIYRKNENLHQIINNLIFPEKGKEDYILNNLFTKLFKKKIVETALGAVDDRVQIGEDLLCTVKAVLLAQSVYVTKSAWYHYRQNPNSMMHAKDANYFEKCNITYNAFRVMLKDHPEYIQLFLPKMAYRISEHILSGLVWNFDWGNSIRVDVNVDNYRMIDDMLKSLNGRIVLYGAGQVGKAYYRELQRNARCMVVAWIDNNTDLYGGKEKIEPPEHIKEIAYDRVVLGVKRSSVAKDMKETLCNLGVPEEKIVWCPPESKVKVLTGEMA